MWGTLAVPRIRGSVEVAVALFLKAGKREPFYLQFGSFVNA